MKSGSEVAASYDPAFRAGMLLSGGALDEPASLFQQASLLGGEAAKLLGSLFLSLPPGELLPERLKASIERFGESLWLAGLLLPKTTGNHVHPRHYAGSCRLNPALSAWGPHWLNAELELSLSQPPAASRWDAVVVAERLEREPVSLTQAGAARKDQERRILTTLGGEEPERWKRALAYARAAGLVRAVGGNLRGFPEAPIRPMDPVAVIKEIAGEAVASAAALWLRILQHGKWVGVEAISGLLRTHAREVLYSPIKGLYPDPFVLPFDDVGWDAVEARLLKEAAELLHICGGAGGHRDASGVTALRLDPGVFPGESGFLLMPDFELLLPMGGLPEDAYARLCRLAPYCGGVGVHRHRLSRASILADMDAGHQDRLGFLMQWSRTGVPANVQDAILAWERQASRFLIWTGVDIYEDEQGNLRVEGQGTHPEVVVDAAQSGSFTEQKDELVVQDGSLAVRAALAQTCSLQAKKGLISRWKPVPSYTGDPEVLLERLKRFHTGPLPATLEVIVRSHTAAPLQAVPALMLKMEEPILEALQRDAETHNFLKRKVGPGEVLVEAADYPKIMARASSLGLKIG